MLISYFKIALRNLWKTRLHSLITIAGLAVGIACCILIILFVKDEWTFDQFHAKADRIYRAWVFEDYGKDEQFFNTVTPYPLGPALKENFNEVAAFVRYNQNSLNVKVGIDSYSETVTVTGEHFFNIFDFKSLYGKLNGTLTGKYNTIISLSTARKYFGVDNAVGETIEMDFGNGPQVFTVRAVLKDPPTNSSLKPQVIISDLNNDVLVGERQLNAWFNVQPETYVVLKKGADAEQLERKFPQMMKQVLGEEYVEGQYNVGLQPLTDIHLNNDMPAGIAPVSDPQYAVILSAIALLILILGGINFVTLSISRSINRSKEVGVRKVVGAQRQQLIAQFLSEAIITTSIATALGVMLAVLNLPLFNELAGRMLVLELSWFSVGVVFGLLIIIGVMAGSYPALVLSGFHPIAVLKGRISGIGRNQGLRKSLVAVQFVLTIFLISSTLLMKRQLNYIQSKNLGYDKEHLLVSQIKIKGREGLSRDINKCMDKGVLLKNELEGDLRIKAVALANHTVGTGGWTNIGYTTEDGKYKTFDMLVTDANYIPAMKMKIVQGRNFSSESNADKRRSIIINETMANEYGWKDAIGKQLPGKKFPDHEVIGVVQDFNYNSLHGEVTPLVIVLDPLVMAPGIENIGIGTDPMPKLVVRVKGDQIPESIDVIKTAWNKVMPEEPFEYVFVDQTLNAQYSQEQNLGKVVSIAAALAIIIGCMGLFALASLNMENRTKEISIRKVLGASHKGILLLLSKEYVFLILLSLIISVPFTVYFMNGWLSSFAYRVEIGVSTFMLTGMLVLVIALITIAYQAIKVTMKQPADNLKYE